MFLLLLLYYGTKCLTWKIISGKGKSSKSLPSQLKSLQLSSPPVSLSSFLHSFSPLSIMHDVTLQSSMQIKERQVGKRKAPVPLAKRRMWSLQGHNSTVCACCCVKKEFAGLMQFALSSFLQYPKKIWYSRHPITKRVNLLHNNGATKVISAG